MSRTGSSRGKTCASLWIVMLLAVPVTAQPSNTAQDTCSQSAAVEQTAQACPSEPEPPAVGPGTPPPPSPQSPRRSTLLLYGSFLALQAMDVHSTLQAVDRGGREANPLLRPLADTPVALSLAKSASAAATIYLVEKVRERNHTAALITMVGLNVAFALVVAHNYRAGHR